MARLFDDAQSEYLSISQAVLGAWPMTMSSWAKTDDDTLLTTVIGTTVSGSLVNRISLFFRGDAGDTLEYQLRDNVGGSVNLSAGTFTQGTWHHSCSRTAGNTDHKVFFDGATTASSSSSVVFPVGLNRTTIGFTEWLDASKFPFSGRIAWPAIWDAALTDDEIASLAAGAYPPTIRPASLVSFWPLGGFDTNETDGGTARDIWGGFDLTAFSDATGPGIADHPGGLIYPSSPLIFPAVAAAAGTVNPFSMGAINLLQGKVA